MEQRIPHPEDMGGYRDRRRYTGPQLGRGAPCPVLHCRVSSVAGRSLSVVRRPPPSRQAHFIFRRSDAAASRLAIQTPPSAPPSALGSARAVTVQLPQIPVIWAAAVGWRSLTLG